jgi:hypothetical protein
MCYQGNCVNSVIIFNNSYVANPCKPNPCQNGGVCVQNSTTGLLFCKCQPNVTYLGNKIGFNKNRFLN